MWAAPYAGAWIEPRPAIARARFQAANDGPHGALFPSDPPSGSYPPKRELEQAIPESSVASCTGDAGTMVWFDACGLHRGGRATAKARTLLVATYASDAALDLLRYRLADPGQYDTLSPAARYAIRAPQA